MAFPKTSFPEIQLVNLGQMLRDAAAKNPEKPATICGDDVVSYRVLDGSTHALAGWLLDKGLGIGDRIAIHWCNSADIARAILAWTDSVSSAEEEARSTPRKQIISLIA
jgi:acyl-CoA synthetase (AMP-forming)/AMP-acid ligase II